MKIGIGTMLGAVYRPVNSLLQNAMRTADNGAMESSQGNIMISAGKE